MALQHPRNMRDDARKPERAVRYHANRCEHFMRLAADQFYRGEKGFGLAVLRNLASHHALQAFAWAAKR